MARRRFFKLTFPFVAVIVDTLKSINDENTIKAAKAKLYALLIAISSIKTKI